MDELNNLDIIGTDYFDMAIGHIEDIVIGEEFQNIQHDFMERYWSYFDNSEENKIIYTDIFNEYTTILEAYIVKELNERMEQFNMEYFAKLLVEKKTHLDGEIFDFLLSLNDFLKFKELILDYKLSKENSIDDLSDGLIIVTSLSNNNRNVR